MASTLLPSADLQIPPPYCQYAAGPCDQSFADLEDIDAVFLFPGEPSIISTVIESAAESLRTSGSNLRVRTWRDFGVTGQIIFCQICKALRGANVAITDVTTLNFNLLFEIGFAIGLGKPVIPIRDTSYIRDQTRFHKLGLIDTLGYLDFQNSRDLAQGIESRLGSASAAFSAPPINMEQPLYVVKSPYSTEGQIKLLSGLDKSGIKFRMFDAEETAQISLQEAHRQVLSSLGVIAHMIDPDRRDASIHNARCAFIGGLAMASGKRTLLLQEGSLVQPIDYRDVVVTYSSASRVQQHLVPLIKGLVAELQIKRFIPTTLPLNALEKLDLGDVAAENEVSALHSYFVPTAQYGEVRRGYARLVVGRKGSGKTAIFYGVRDAYASSKDNLVLALKPEVHQFTKLREIVLSKLSSGLQEHVLTAFWNYLLLTELAFSVLENEYQYSQRDARQSSLYARLAEIYDYNPAVEEGDFSERLYNLIDNIVRRSENFGEIQGTGEVTELVYERDIKVLTEVLSDYLARKDGVWLLLDNLDKGWPIEGVRDEDILLLRSLLEAGRKLQRQLDRKHVPVHVVLFIRNDIYSLLLNTTPDKGKDNAIALDWDDAELFKRIIERRISASAEVDGSFETLWPQFFETHVNGESSFEYLLRRTFMRPRDLIRLLKQCISVAVNRGHERVSESDILQAEKSYSEQQLQEVSFELRDVFALYPDILYTFLGERSILDRDDLTRLLKAASVAEKDADRIVHLLLWFGFLGIQSRSAEERYAYQFNQNIERLMQGSQPSPRYVIHPAFRPALETL